MSFSPSLLTVTEIELVYRNKLDARDRPLVRGSNAAYSLLLASWDMNKIELVEQFKILLLDRRGACIGVSLVATGGITDCLVDPRIVFGISLKSRATSMILAHNHPSENLEPSDADISTTQKLQKAGEFLNIRVLDHLILGLRDYYSFADKGLLP